MPNTRVSVHGKYSYLQANGQNFYCRKWDGTHSCKWDEITGADDNGKENSVAGLESFKGTLEMVWDAGMDPFADPPNFSAGQVITNLKLYKSKNSPPWTLPKAGVDDFKDTGNVDGVCSFTVSFHNLGDFTKPSGTFVYP